MPISRTIGISLACLVTSACAITKTPEKTAAYYRGQGGSQSGLGNSQMLIGRPRSFAGGVVAESGSGTDNARFARAELGCFNVEAALSQCDSNAAPWRGAARRTGNGQVGKAAWYDLVGHKTASGEILDNVTATAAHRSLPLASFAKVTDLDNGRAVIVKINDRGPYTPGRILDLSPRAADVLDMKSAGVATVIIQPLLRQRDLIVATFQTYGTAAMR